jgi:DNA-binding PadR family transcriptional regulator
VGRHNDGLSRQNEPMVLVLTSLAGGPKHGYTLNKDIEDFAGVSLGPGTLYGAITRLEERGLIEPAGEDKRRKPYRITPAGRQALAAVVHDMHALAAVGGSRLRLALPSAGWA